jgi:uncharacterized protein (DUF58 family)
LHSKLYEPATVTGVTLLLDFHREAYDRNHEPHGSELAVAAAAAVANAVYELGQQIGLVTNGRDAVEGRDSLMPLVVPAGRGQEQLPRILETLARVELSAGLPLPELIRETLFQLPLDARVVAILSRVTEVEAMALAMLKRRGLVVEAIVNAPEDFDYSLLAPVLWREGIACQHLLNEASLAGICGSMTAY